jgi:DoxX
VWVTGRSLPGSPLSCTADNSKSSRDSGARRPSAKSLETELVKSRHRRRGEDKGLRDASATGAPAIVRTARPACHQTYEPPHSMNLLRLLTSPLPVPASWYAIPLRLIVGFGFIQHGYAKLARGPEDFIGVLHAMGLPSSFLLGWLTIIVELVGGRRWGSLRPAGIRN